MAAFLLPPDPLTKPSGAAALEATRLSGRGVAAILGLSLFASGAAGLVNQVVWQRALKVFLGGSETVCSMIVVLVFMAGLGLGSIWMSRRVSRLRQPLRAFAGFELALAGINVAVCGLLASDLTASVYSLQRLAMAVGLPLLALYAVLATLVLAVPCLLMGATMPLAAETCQRTFKLRDSRVLGLLFCVNTLGSVLGTVVSSGWMIPHWGQTLSLLAAVGLNLVAGLVLFLLSKANHSRVLGEAIERSADPRQPILATSQGWRPSVAELLAFGLGFCALGYEMYLFRLVPLRHQPLPFTFAAVLAGFLLFWSIGAGLASHCKLSISAALRLTALACAATIPLYVIDQPAPVSNAINLVGFILVRFPYYLPCLFFGYLFSRVMEEAASSWGRDVGRLAAWNTLGSCLGTVLMTFVGYEIPFFVMVLALALLLYALQEFVDGQCSPTMDARAGRFRWALPLGAAIGVVALSLICDPSRFLLKDRMYSGRDGVLFITPDRHLFWDGLWHSRLAQDGDYVGTKNWYVAVCPVLSHPTGDIRDACVIGVGTGITVGALAQLDTIERIDGYDITQVLKSVFRDFPDGTLNIATNPKVHLHWQDARTGLALNPRQYDLIQTQPLYLKQAGSALLNSVEFYRLVSSRLKPGGVFCLYSNGTPEQAFVIRETAAKVFPYRESFLDGYLVILSNDPIDLSETALARRLKSKGPLWDEIRRYPITATAADLGKLLDHPPLQAGDGQLYVTDDFPIVEYPEQLAARIRAKGYSFAMPKPR